MAELSSSKTHSACMVMSLSIISAVRSQKCMSNTPDGAERERGSEIKAGAFLVTIPPSLGTESTNNRSGWGQVFC